MTGTLRICNNCVMDTTVPGIVFNNDGVCNYCKNAQSRIEKEYSIKKKDEKIFRSLIEDLKKNSKKNKPGYDCVIGISGGIDSSYAAYLLKKNGINPLAIHFDNGWNSELAIKNIETVLNKLDIKLHTVVVDWEEFKDIQLAFINSSISNLEIPTDHAILSTLLKIASKHNVPIVHGGNLSTESIMPATWMHDNKDFWLIRKLCKLNNIRIKTFPILSIPKILYYFFLKRIKYIGILNYINYNKDEALKILENLGYKKYEQKHFESIFTRFFQGYILPNKFKIDKRKAHLSSLIVTKQITREQAIKILSKNSIYDENQIKKDKDYFCKKFNLSTNEFDQYMKKSEVSADKYSNYNKIFKKYSKEISDLKNFVTARKIY